MLYLRIGCLRVLGPFELRNIGLLDEKTRVAGCHMIRDLVLDVIQKEGIETYKKFIREIIEDGRRGFVNQVKTMLIPGKYRQVSFS